MSLIRENALRELAQGEAITSVRVIGTRGGYSVQIRYGSVERTLSSVRGDVRLFTLDNAAKFLRGIGLGKFEVDATQYEQARMRKARPDRAEALRQTVTKPRQQELL